MTREKLHKEIGKLLYIEDFGMVDIIMASIVANSAKIGDPVWLTLIGPSSSGKSQLIRPLAEANPDLIFQLDDMTPNSLMAGTAKSMEETFLGQRGDNTIMSMDDLTVLFSKNTESQAEILSQFRMLYDGRFSKLTAMGKGQALVWEGYMGMIAGSTPSIYRFFNDVADMGERFVNYRMHDYNTTKAVDFVMHHQMASKELNTRITSLFHEYIGSVMGNNTPTTLSDEDMVVIRDTAKVATHFRTSVHLDDRSGQVDEFPVPEMPFRVMKQLTNIAKAMMVMVRTDDPEADTLPQDLLRTLQWCAYSLANDKRRAYFRSCLALYMDGKKITKRNIAAYTGLSADVVGTGLSQLSALGLIDLDEGSGTHVWELNYKSKGLQAMVRDIDPPIIKEINEGYE